MCRAVEIARSQWCVIVDPDAEAELPDGRVGEIWLHGDNVGRGYWDRPEETQQTFGAVLRSQTAVGEPRDGAPAGATWLRTGDLGFYLDGELYVTGRIADLIFDRRPSLYPDDVEATYSRGVADRAPGIRRRIHRAFGPPASSW